VLVLIPEPTVLPVVSYALGQGWRTALPMAIGVALGGFIANPLAIGIVNKASGGLLIGADVATVTLTSANR
jgi:hypothetical protein